MASYLLAPFQFAMVDYFKSLADPRIKDYFVIRNGLVPTFAVIAFYLWISLYYGKRFMANRKPYEPTKTMFTYNVLLAAANLYAFYKAIVLFNYLRDLAIVRAPDPRNTSKEEMEKIYYGYIYLGTKYLDLFGKLLHSGVWFNLFSPTHILADTVFFLLRKKYSHISFLHVYHHSTVAFMGTVFFVVHPTGNICGVFIICNTLIHFVMYTYYALSSLGPSVRPYLWWKRYITQMQIGQFVVYSLYFVYFIFNQEGYNNAIIVFGGLQSPLYLYLFGKFYYDTYYGGKKPIDRHARGTLAATTAAAAAADKKVE